MAATFRQVHPVLGARDVPATVEWYVSKLGFSLAFDDGGDPTRYAGLRRDDVELHLQWHDVESFAASDGDCPAYRFYVNDPDALFVELQSKGVLRPDAAVRDTTWGTREFALYDPNGMALFFYRDL
jgi:catechol 2,3-dioxygenase-like lactoylglutathione lyase family enzyme